MKEVKSTLDIPLNTRNNRVRKTNKQRPRKVIRSDQLVEAKVVYFSPDEVVGDDDVF